MSKRLGATFIALSMMSGVISQAIVTGTASWYDPPANQIGACGRPLRAMGPYFVALAPQYFTGSEDNTPCGKQVNVVDLVTGIHGTGYVMDVCTTNCTGTTNIQYSLPFWLHFYGNNTLTPANQLLKTAWQLVDNNSSSTGSISSVQSSDAANTLSTTDTSPSSATQTSSSATSANTSAAAAGNQSSSMMGPTSGIIVGAVLGAIVASILFISLIVCIRRRRRRSEARSAAIAANGHYRKPERQISDASSRAAPEKDIPMDSRSPSTTMDQAGNRQNRISTYRKPVPAYEPEADHPSRPDEDSLSGNSVHSTSLSQEV